MPDVQEVIQSMLIALNAPPRGGGKPVVERPVVCISRDHGSGGDEVARLLAKRLGVGLYDRVILDRIAQRLHTDPETMRAIEAGCSEIRDLWLYSLVTGQDLAADHYKRHLINVVVSLARSGGVILGGGAHLILARSGALRLRFTGSAEVRAQRVAAAEGLSLPAAEKRIEEVDHGRGKFVWDNFQQRLNDPRTFDLMVNTDHLSDPHKVVDLVVSVLAILDR